MSLTIKKYRKGICKFCFEYWVKENFLKHESGRTGYKPLTSGLLDVGGTLTARCPCLQFFEMSKACPTALSTYSGHIIGPHTEADLKCNPLTTVMSVKQYAVLREQSYWLVPSPALRQLYSISFWGRCVWSRCGPVHCSAPPSPVRS